MNILVFDIETIPEDESITITTENREKYSLNKKHARILCIGYIKILSDEVIKKIITGNEPKILKIFWQTVQDADIFVGHNIYEFDIPFLLYRSSINNIRPTKIFRLFSYRSECWQICDTLLEAKKIYHRYISLNELIGLLSLKPLLTGINGSEVYTFHKRGRDDVIHQYCMEQVNKTLEIYNKMSLI